MSIVFPSAATRRGWALLAVFLSGGLWGATALLLSATAVLDVPGALQPGLAVRVRLLPSRGAETGGPARIVIADEALCPDPQAIIDAFEPEFAQLLAVTLMLPWEQV